MASCAGKQALLIAFAVLLLVFFASEAGVAQNKGPMGKAGIKSPPGVGSGKGPPAVKPPASKGSSLSELDRARKYLRKKHDSLEPKTTPTSRPGMVPTVPAPWPLEFLPLADDDVSVLSTHWRTERRFGDKPFTSVSIKLANRSPYYLCVLDLLLDGWNVERLDDSDDRPLPDFPLKLQRFPGLGHRLMSPIAPLSQQTLTFTLPAALKSTAKLKGYVASYVKFKCDKPHNWDPVKVVSYETRNTETLGKPHMGILLTLENEASQPMAAMLRVDLSEMSTPGGDTFFFTEVYLKGKEHRSFVIRGIPDEGIHPSEPEQEVYPAHFKIRRVTVVDLQF